MDHFISFGLFRIYVHEKQRLGPFYHEIGSGRPVAGVSLYRSRISASVNSPCMCVTKTMPGTIILHVPTFYHSYTHILGTNASFLGIQVLQWSLSGEILTGGRRSTPIAFSVRGLTNRFFCFLLVCLGHMYMLSKCWVHFTMK
jgi:hypothetical protein